MQINLYFQKLKWTWIEMGRGMLASSTKFLVVGLRRVHCRLPYTKPHLHPWFGVMGSPGALLHEERDLWSCARGIITQELVRKADSDPSPDHGSICFHIQVRLISTLPSWILEICIYNDIKGKKSFTIHKWCLLLKELCIASFWKVTMLWIICSFSLSPFPLLWI